MCSYTEICADHSCYLILSLYTCSLRGANLVAITPYHRICGGVSTGTLVCKSLVRPDLDLTPESSAFEADLFAARPLSRSREMTNSVRADSVWQKISSNDQWRGTGPARPLWVR